MSADQIDARVVVAEDDTSNQVLLQRILKTAGITDVRFVSDEDALLEVVRSFDPDLVLLDLHLGQADGLECLRALARSDHGWSWRNILLVTGEARPDLDDAAAQLGARGVVRKPFRIDELLATVAPLIEDGRRDRHKREHPER